MQTSNLFFLSGHHIRIVLLVCVALLNTTSRAQEQEIRLTLDIRNATLDEFVRQVEQHSGLSFVYGEDVRISRRISLQARSLPLREVLRQAFGKEPVRFSIEGRHILLSAAPLAQKAAGRKFTISGYVTDSASAETLIGANILERRRSVGTASNSFGFYSLTLPEGETELTVSYLGYEPFHTRFVLRSDTVLHVKLTTNNRLSEVVVTSDKREAGIQATAMGAHEIPLTQIRHTPAILGEADLLKTIQLMPGVQAGMEGFSGLYVRGGGPDQNLVLLDGIPIYNADHLMGLFSIFTPEAVKKTTLFKNSFPARYGGRLSSIVDVRTNEGDMYRYHGTLSIGLLTDKLHVEGPIRKGYTSFSLSARCTHTAFAKHPIKDEDPPYYTDYYNYYFYDINAKLNHKFNDRSRLFLSFYKGKDHYHYDSENHYEETYRSEDKTHLNWGNTVVAGRWNYVLTNRLFCNTSVAFNNYQMRINGDQLSEDYRTGQKQPIDLYSYNSEYRSGIRDYSVHVDFDYTPLPAHHVKFGAEYLFHTFRPETMATRIREGEPGKLEVDTAYHSGQESRLHGHEVSLYAEDNLDLSRNLAVNAGMRISLFQTQGKGYLSAQPRLSARYRFGKGFSAKASYSCMAQYVHLLTSTPLSMPTDLWVPITKNIRPMYANQYSIGGYYEGLPGWELSAEGYFKQMRHVLEYQDGASFFGTSTHWEDKVEAGTGRSYGLEVMAQKCTGRTTGWLSYTLARSDRQFKQGTINGGRRYPYKYDRRHSVSLCLNHRFGKRIDAGASWVFYTGGCISVPERQTVCLTPDGTLVEMPYLASRNNYRLPASHRLNLSVNFNKKTRHGMRTWNISLYNAYNAMNPNIVYSERIQSSTGQPDTLFESRTVIKKMTLLPCIPSVTYTYRF